MSDQTLFTNDSTDSGKPQHSLFDDKLKEITGDNGEPKYKDVNAALEALKHSQTFIETLKAEKRALEDQYRTVENELKTRASVEDVVGRLTKSGQPNTGENDHTQTGGLDEEKVKQLITSTLTQAEQQRLLDQNLMIVVNKLSQVYGDKAKAVIQTRAKELNTTPTELEKLARQNPEMALTLIGVGGTTSTSSTTSSINTQFTPPDNNPRPQFTKSLTRGGATNKELGEAWRQVGAYTKKRLGIE